MPEPLTDPAGIDPIGPDADLAVLLGRLDALEAEDGSLRARRADLEAEERKLRSLPDLPTSSLFESALRRREARQRLPAIHADLDIIGADLEENAAHREGVLLSLANVLRPGQWIRPPLRPRRAVCLEDAAGVLLLHTAPWRLARHAPAAGEPGGSPFFIPEYARIEAADLLDALLAAAGGCVFSAFFYFASEALPHTPPLGLFPRLAWVLISFWAAVLVLQAIFRALTYLLPRRPLTSALSEYRRSPHPWDRPAAAVSPAAGPFALGDGPAPTKERNEP